MNIIFYLSIAVIFICAIIMLILCKKNLDSKEDKNLINTRFITVMIIFFIGVIAAIVYLAVSLGNLVVFLNTSMIQENIYGQSIQCI